MKIEAIDLFCGIGGITHGFIRSGITVIAGYDNDKTCQYAYESNNKSKFICADITNVNSEDIVKQFSKNTIRAIIGCAPCQPYSTYAYKYKKEQGHDDPRYEILRHFSRIIQDVQPELVSMENVPDLYRRGYSQYLNFIKILEDNNYYVFQEIIDCAKYGVPQSRKRLVVLASKLGAISLIPPTHQKNYVSVRDTIAKLQPILHGTHSPKDPIHKSSKLTTKNLKRIKATPEGGSWRDWPEDLLLECHKKETGKTYPSVYGRMRWDDIGPTITTQSYNFGTGRFGHPEQDRAISLREAALLQTFPENYQFVPLGKEVVFTSVGRHIGNAVPIKLAEAIALSMKKHIKEINSAE